VAHLAFKGFIFAQCYNFTLKRKILHSFIKPNTYFIEA